jgi:predicted Zn-dependent protease with MMP-like domain
MGDMTGNIDWTATRAPNLAQFERLAEAAWRRLPAQFRDLCGDVVIRVEELASEDVLRDLDIDDPFHLLGLYQGISLAKKSVLDVPQGPNMVFLYRRALLDCWAEGTETLGHLVSHVLIHEIGHHFGLSDADMERIEAAAVD